jgi:predicted metal-dependent phosphoesterase TrpH
MTKPYIDFHTHTTLSDGAYTPMQLCRMAREAGIGTLAITDHNRTYDLTELRSAFPTLRLIQGVEISCLYRDSMGKENEIHVVGLGVDPDNPRLKALLVRNQPDRRPYLNAILDRLRACGIDFGSYDELCKLLPHRQRIGRMDIAKLLMEKGYVSSVEEGFDEYIGAHGKRRAYVPNPGRYVSMEDAVAAVVDAGGAAVLAHLYYYQLNDAENSNLLRHFKSLSGENGGMEVFYSRYTPQQRQVLRSLADRYGLMYSAASDYHGQDENETLTHRFCPADCARLLHFLGATESSTGF